MERALRSCMSSSVCVCAAAVKPPERDAKHIASSRDRSGVNQEIKSQDANTTRSATMPHAPALPPRPSNLASPKNKGESSSLAVPSSASSPRGASSTLSVPQPAATRGNSNSAMSLSVAGAVLPSEKDSKAKLGNSNSFNSAMQQSERKAVDPNVLKKLPQNHRNKVAIEIATTERTYVDSLTGQASITPFDCLLNAPFCVVCFLFSVESFIRGPPREWRSQI